MSDHEQKPTVTLYVVPDCPLCAHAREWLNRHRVAFTERNVAEDFGAFRAMYKLTKQRLVPVLATKAGAAFVRPDENLMERVLCG